MGNGCREETLLTGIESPAIAHIGVVASVEFGIFGLRQRDLRGNRRPGGWQFTFRPKN